MSSLDPIEAELLAYEPAAVYHPCRPSDPKPRRAMGYLASLGYDVSTYRPKRAMEPSDQIRADTKAAILTSQVPYAVRRAPLVDMCAGRCMHAQ